MKSLALLLSLFVRLDGSHLWLRSMLSGDLVVVGCSGRFRGLRLLLGPHWALVVGCGLERSSFVGFDIRLAWLSLLTLLACIVCVEVVVSDVAPPHFFGCFFSFFNLSACLALSLRWRRLSIRWLLS